MLEINFYCRLQEEVCYYSTTEQMEHIQHCLDMCVCLQHYKGKSLLPVHGNNVCKNATRYTSYVNCLPRVAIVEGTVLA